MAKIVIMRGLPASGKSTEAKELLEEMGNGVRINKDLLRTMLHFDKWNGKKEDLTRTAARTLAETFLKQGINVIIDDTNLNAGTMQGWKDLAKALDARVKVCEMDTPYWDCLVRDKAREQRGERAVGSHVIWQMALENGLVPSKEYILCDIDGTLADITHRLPFVREGKKDWKGFFANIPWDKFRSEVWQEVQKEDCPVILVSARPEEYRNVTMHWLEENGVIQGRDYETIIMRRSGDSREDSIVKEEILNRYFKNHKIRKVFDDRPRVIRMWREHGLEVEDVGSGVEF